MISIVTLTKNVLLLKRAVRSVLRTHHLLDGIEMIVVDDGLTERPELFPSMRYLDGVKPFTFAKNVNLGIRAASKEADIFLMTDDTYFISEEGLALLQAESKANDRLGLIGPVFARQERTPSQRLGHLDPERGLWIEESGYLTFSAMYIRREILSSIGEIDECYTGYGYEDNDYCLQAKMNGFSLGVLPSVVMGHGNEMGEATTTYRRNPQFLRMLQTNKEIFLRKWGKILLGIDEQRIPKLFEFIEML